MMPRRPTNSPRFSSTWMWYTVRAPASTTEVTRVMPPRSLTVSPAPSSWTWTQPLPAIQNRSRSVATRISSSIVTDQTGSRLAGRIVWIGA
ncbi:hypothetical protein SAMN05444166_2144 [Singulisphaera sp. GP187]|nr:hypothetical protein SAMN05444166_2144 [Singulisphaera sp. GP187]